jgi:formylglycine-generating enzyme required for sulfatase activity
VDESPFGVFDLCGSAMEWVEDWYDERRGLRRIAGGSWAQGDATALESYNPRGARPDRADREFGVRLVAEPRAAAHPETTK